MPLPLAGLLPQRRDPCPRCCPQIVGTDHAVFNSTQKEAGRHDFRVIPNGVNGIEERCAPAPRWAP